MEQLQTIRKDIKVLLMSGYTSDAIIHRGVFDGRTGFLQKPFTPHQFARSVREVLDRPAMAMRDELESA
jgi:DNA-binding NarL/FixJ family response regulator